MSNIPYFISEERDYGWTRIKGRGFIKTFSADQLPEGMWNPSDLTGTYCRIDWDGKIYKIIGVETFKHMISPEDPYDKNFSLMVSLDAPLISIEVKKTIYRTDLESLIEEFQKFLNTVSRDSGLETPRMYVDGYKINLHGERWLTAEELENYNKGLFDD